jgi:hypothetical protein
VSAQADRDSIKKLTENGMELMPVSAAMMADIRKRAGSLQQEYLQRVPASAPIVKQYLNSMGRA